MIFLTLLQRQLRDSRWSLLTSILAFFGLALLWNWGVSINQFPPAEIAADAEVGSELESATGSDAEKMPETALSDEGNRSETQAIVSTPRPESSGVDGGGQNSQPTTSASENRPEEVQGSPPRGSRPGRRRGMRIYLGMGVPPDQLFDPEDPPTLLMQICMANHPLILLTLIGWAISRASAAVAGEIERGTLDLTLTRPVRRSTYLASQIVVAILVFTLLGAALVAGHLTAPRFFQLRNTPELRGYVPSTLMMVAVGLGIFGYTLIISSREISRARTGILGVGITLAGLAGIITSQQLEGYEWVSKLSVFEHYSPVGITAGWDDLMTRNLTILFAIFGVSCLASFVLFMRRDLPTSG